VGIRQDFAIRRRTLTGKEHLNSDKDLISPYVLPTALFTWSFQFKVLLNVIPQLLAASTYSIGVLLIIRGNSSILHNFFLKMIKHFDFYGLMARPLFFAHSFTFPSSILLISINSLYH